MKNTLTILLIILLGILAYTYAAYTRPEEPAGRALHNWLNEYQPRPTLRQLEIVPASATPYTPAELSEIYPTH